MHSRKRFDLRFFPRETRRSDQIRKAPAKQLDEGIAIRWYRIAPPAEARTCSVCTTSQWFVFSNERFEICIVDAT